MCKKKKKKKQREREREEEAIKDTSKIVIKQNQIGSRCTEHVVNVSKELGEL